MMDFYPSNSILYVLLTSDIAIKVLIVQKGAVKSVEINPAANEIWEFLMKSEGFTVNFALKYSYLNSNSESK